MTDANKKLAEIRKGFHPNRWKTILYMLKQGKLFLCKGYWSGNGTCYNQTYHFSKEAEEIKNLAFIQYTDNTRLDLRVEPITNKFDLVPEKDGYGALIRKCIKYNTSFVKELPQ